MIDDHIEFVSIHPDEKIAREIARESAFKRLGAIVGDELVTIRAICVSNKLPNLEYEGVCVIRIKSVLMENIHGD
jgi:hypothetical protein